MEPARGCSGTLLQQKTYPEQLYASFGELGLLRRLVLAACRGVVEARSPGEALVKEGHENVTKLLLEAGADVEAHDDSRRTPLHWGLNGQTPLSWAAWEGHSAAAELLLDVGANLESNSNRGRTPLWLAAENNREDVVKLLLKKGANMESRGNYGQTPLS
ncbi:hypothetical protein FGG08_006593 [Glutinoglossum americanum]|uniref:Uncharacterized protein n=1 Tax=Glutinoglossum americanum TaxID=1670608 RepID=A0A9P8I0Z1_9PEZI|nr:hypothetical protein FGG08_006593 [Glutinoglossum americanum]